MKQNINDDATRRYGGNIDVKKKHEKIYGGFIMRRAAVREYRNGAGRICRACGRNRRGIGSGKAGRAGIRGACKIRRAGTCGVWGAGTIGV